MTAARAPTTAERDAARKADGAAAEALAARFLEARGLRVLRRNLRTRFGELDLIAQDDDTLVFVEVRLRRRRDFGGAAASISPRSSCGWCAARAACLRGCGTCRRAASTRCCSTRWTMGASTGSATSSSSADGAASAAAHASR